MQNVFSIGQLREVLYPVFDAYGIRKAILFGSYGKGQATEKSDIDLVVDSGLRGFGFIGLLTDIQQVVGKEVDLLDVTHIRKGSVVDREIQRTGVVLYEK